MPLFLLHLYVLFFLFVFCFCALKTSSSPLLGDFVTAEESEDEEENVPLSLLQISLRQQAQDDVNPILEMLHVINPNVEYSADDIRHWNNAENVLPVFVDDDSNTSTDNEDIGDSPTKEVIPATRAVQIFEQAIEWAEKDSNHFEDNLVLHKFRNLALQILKTTCTKQKSLKDFFVTQ